MRSPEARWTGFISSGRKFLAAGDYARATLEFKNAIGVKPNDPEGHYQLGLAYLATGEWRSAALHLTRATELNPRHDGAQVRIAAMMASTKDQSLLEDARKRLEEVFRSSPENVDAVTALAITEWKLAKPEDAERRLRQAVGRAPGNPVPAVALAKMQAARNDYVGAEDTLKAALGNQPSANALVTLGEFYLWRSRMDDAEAQFRRAMQVDPNHPRALHHLAAIRLRSGDLEAAGRLYKRLSNVPDKRYRPLHAAFLFQTGRTEPAIAEFQELLRREPADRNTRNHLLAAFVASNRLADAAKLLDSALARNPDDVDCLLRRGALRLMLQTYTAAEHDLLRVLQLRQDSAEGHYLLGKLYEARGLVLSQSQEYEQALQARPDFLRARLDLSMSMIRRNAAKTALEIVDEAPAEQKNLPALVLQRGWALLALGLGDRLEALIAQEQAAARIPDLPVLAATLRLHQQRWADARTLARQALAHNPGDVRALEILARSHQAEGKLPDAVREVSAYAGRNPNAAHLQYFLGTLLAAAGDTTSARAAFSRARAVRPGFVDADLGLIGIDLAEGRRGAARNSLTALLAERGENVTARLWLGNLEHLEGNYQAAIGHYRKVVESDASHVTALNNLAYLLAHTDRLVEALGYARKAVALARDDAAASDTLGWILYKQGEYRLAVAHLERAVAAASTAVRNYHLGLAYLKAGKPDAGRQKLEIALKLDPGGAEAGEIRELLNRERL
jgi:tetratricopeptide (TPR) repeat protein